MGGGPRFTVSHRQIKSNQYLIDSDVGSGDIVGDVVSGDIDTVSTSLLLLSFGDIAILF